MIEARSPLARVLGAALFAVLAGSGSAPAQQRWDSDLKDSRQVRSQFREVTEKNRRSVVVFLRDGAPCAEGFVISSDGWVLSKASELFGSLTARLSDDREVPVGPIVSEGTCDLALAHLEVDRAPPPVVWSERDEVRVGQITLALSGDEMPLSMGVVGVPVRVIERDRGMLGIEMSDSQQGPEVRRVLPRTSAALHGLQEGDIILRVDQRTYESRDSLIRSLSRLHVLDEIELDVLRGEETLHFVVKLGSWDEDSGTMNGPLSRVRSPFAAVFQHDCIVHPDDCGGPIVDLSGEVIGVNIARVGRTGGYAVPAAKVRELLPDLLERGRAAPRSSSSNSAH